VKYNYALIGKDRPGLNDGNYIFYNYDTRTQDYGHYVGSGLESNLTHMEFRIEYQVNPNYNMNIIAGISDRNFSNDFEEKHSSLVYFGLRMALENYYFDF
jgi:hypothetical protein